LYRFVTLAISDANLAGICFGLLDLPLQRCLALHQRADFAWCASRDAFSGTQHFLPSTSLSLGQILPTARFADFQERLALRRCELAKRSPSSHSPVHCRATDETCQYGIAYFSGARVFLKSLLPGR
jgi:hypothetical protein